MHAILTPVGSAGDVNPFVVLGRALRARGHRVTLIAAAVFANVAASAGLEFVAVGTAADYDRVTRNPDLWDPRRGPRVVFGEVAAHLRAGYAAIDAAYEPGRTVLVGHSLSFPTRVFEERHGAPALTIHLAPSVFRSAFQQAMLPTGADLSRWPTWLKRTLWWGIDRVGVDPMIVPALNRWRSELGLPPVSRVLASWLHSPQRVLALFPDWFGEPQPDWPRQTMLTGFVLSDAGCAPGGEQRAQHDALEGFLASGEPPIVFTPGSANRFAATLFRAGLDAASAIGRRALFVTSYQEQVPVPLPRTAFHAPYAPFSTLFPRAAAVVHHGGIGTCAQAFAAGVPQLVTPMGFDQYDNAARAARLGVAEMVPSTKITSTRMASALQRLLSNPGVAAACRRWQREIDPDEAVRLACDAIEDAGHVKESTG